MRFQGLVLGCALTLANIGVQPGIALSGIAGAFGCCDGFQIGLEGFGFDVATPLAKKLNLRGGASFLNYTRPFNEDGIEIDAALVLRKVAERGLSPLGGSFGVSPGLVMHNRNRAIATAMVPAGQRFDLNHATYYSSPADPLHGVAAVSFGEKFAPSFTLG